MAPIVQMRLTSSIETKFRKMTLFITLSLSGADLPRPSPSCCYISLMGQLNKRRQNDPNSKAQETAFKYAYKNF